MVTPAEKTATTVHNSPRPDVTPKLVVQPKLSVGAPGDRFEQEADQMAEKVMRMETGTGPAVQPMPLSPLVSATAVMSKPSSLASPVQFGIQPSLKTDSGNKDKEPEEEEKPELVRRYPLRNFSAIPTAFIQRQKEEEDSVPNLQGKFLQRSTDLQQTPSGAFITSDSFAARLKTAGSGSSLPDVTRQGMEGAFNADFSTVRVHIGPDAVQLSQDIGARAFTHRNHIFFNQNEYNPTSPRGKRLLAHELTHTLQQGAAVQRSPQVSQTSIAVQAGFFDGLGNFLGGLRDRVVRFVQNLPGYFLLSVLLGSDPITGRVVERNGMNFIRGFLLLLPGGEQKFTQLRDSGGLQRASEWMDEQIAVIRNLGNRFEDAYNNSRNSLRWSDALNIEAAFERISGFFAPVVRDAITYGWQLASQVLNFIRNALLNRLVSFVQNRTRAYPLLRTLLGRDPITGEEVPRSIENILHGFLMLTEAGEAYYNKLLETGTLARGAAWLRAQLATLPTIEEVLGAFSRAWNSLSFADLASPIAAFQRIYDIFSDPIGRIVRFVANVGREILRLIKEALLNQLREHAHQIRGYRLLTVLLGTDPVSGQGVERSALNILNGFIELVAGPEQFAQIQQSGAVERMFEWLDGVTERLGISFTMIRNLFIGLWNSFTINDLLQPLVAFRRIMARFGEPLQRVLAFIVEVIKKIVEVILNVMNVPIDVGRQIVTRVMAAYDIIKRDPIAFFMNLLRAVKQGFEQFFSRIGQYLLQGVSGWLFSELESAGIRPPQDLSLRSVLGFVMEVLGITVERIWQKLAAHPSIGPERVARLRGMLNQLSGIWTIIQEVIRDGPGALWRHLQEQLSNLWSTVLEQVRSWVMQQVITQVITRLLSMLDPTGIMAVVRSVQAVYNAIETFMGRVREIMNIINSFVGGVLEIAQGNIVVAANYLERTMAGAMPTVIAFLANQVGLSGLGHRIGHMIEQVRGVVDRALGWLIDRMVRLGSAALEMGRSAVRGVVNWWNKQSPVTMRNGERHTIYLEGNGDNFTLMIRSVPKTYTEFIRNELNRNGITTPVAGSNEANALIKAGQVDAELRRYRSIPQDGRVAWGQNLSILMDELATLTGGLTINMNVPNPPSRVRWGSPNSEGFGTLMIAELLSENNVRGEEAQADRRAVLGWDFARSFRRISDAGNPSPIYVKGHLLNANLGGRANVNNLTPITKTMNDDHKIQVEEPVKQLVLGQSARNRPMHTKRVVNYSVDVEYSGHPVRTSLINQYSREMVEARRLHAEELRKPVPNPARTSEYRARDEAAMNILALLTYEGSALTTAFICDWEQLSYNATTQRWEPVPNTARHQRIPHNLPTQVEHYRPVFNTFKTELE